MGKKLSVVFLTAYFGKIPPYFHLWKKSAEFNQEFTFFIYTDLPIQVSDNSNIKIKYTSFNELQKKIKIKLGQHCKINDPYKLCDYKPAYGYLFAEDIREFDFWGFCDIDVIWGNIGKIITQDVLNNNDKLFMHGHFCLMRNTPKMTLLFKEKYPMVLNFDYASRTNYNCHFDENGTIAYAPDFDKKIRYNFPGNFYDVPYTFYQMMYQGSEACVIWKDGTLMMYWDGANKSREVLYVHLQKRNMLSIPKYVDNKIVVYRNVFLNEVEESPSKILNTPIDIIKQSIFIEELHTRRRNDLIKKFKSGAIKFRLFRQIYRWKSR